MGIAVRAEKLVKMFPVRNRAVNGLSLDVAPGELLVLKGEPGSGKTTAMKLLAGLLRPDDGAVTLDGKPTAKWNDEAWSRYRARNIGNVTSEPVFIEGDALYNIMLPLAVAGTPTGKRERLATEAAQAAGLDAECYHKEPRLLTQKERIICCMARAVANSPGLMLLDDPYKHLAQKDRQELADRLKALCKTKNMTAILFTISGEYGDVADRTITIKEGRMRDSQ